MASTTTTTTTSGNTTTTTTTTSVNAAASAAGAASVPTHNGNIIGILMQTFDTAANAERMDLCYEAMSNLHPAGTKTSIYCLKVSETVRYTVFIWNGEKGFLPLEAVFGQQPIVQELGTSYTAECIVTGSVSTEVRAKMGMWAALPNWTITFDFDAMVGISTEAMSPHSVGHLLEFDFSSSETRDEYIEDFKQFGYVCGNRMLTYCVMKRGEKGVAGVCMFKTVADMDAYLKIDFSEDVMSKQVAKSVGNMTSMTPYIFGNIGAPEVAQSIIAWPMAKPVELTASPFGGDNQPVFATQTMYFKTAADRDNVCTQLDNADNFVNGGDGSHFAHFKVGETGVMSFFGAKDFATFREQEALFMTKPNVIEAWGRMAATKNYFFGNTCAGFWDDMAGWGATFPVMCSVAAEKMGGASFHNFSGKDLCVFMGEQTFKTEEGVDEIIAMSYAPEQMKAYEEHNVTVQSYRTSPKSIGFIQVASNQDDWVKANDVFAPNAARITEIIEKAEVHVLGPQTEKGKAALDGWNSAPWCTIVYHDKYYGSL